MSDLIAIIVTYNRKHLLLRCLQAVARQTHPPSKIILVDNASTDGTVEALQSAGWLNRADICLIKLDLNLGGAGGFAAGWKHALELGANWLWMMDDDGYPAQDCLEKLLHAGMQYRLDAISPVQADIDDATKPAFPTFDAHGRAVTKLPASPTHGENFVPFHANLFNGLLIQAETVRHLGLPRVELFIRGDEVEYTRRMLQNGTRFGTLINATFYHPSDRSERHRFFFGIGFAREASNDFKNYYMFRNKGLAFRENGWLWMLPFDTARYVYYFLIHKNGDIHGLKLWSRAMLDGLFKRLGRHPDF